MEVKVRVHYQDQDGVWSYDTVLSTDHESSRGRIPVLVIRGQGYRPGERVELVELKYEKFIWAEQLHLVPDPAEDAQDAGRMIEAWCEQRPLPQSGGRSGT